jgi:DNA (cytosine-5)-methyltransferase 1
MGRPINHVDLCSGIGGFALGFEWAELSTPILFCDTEKWCREILKKHWPDVPIAEDVKELANDPERLVPDCNILSAGYPCQPFSVAGKQKGTEDDRHIWPYILKIVAQKRPTWCVFENVYGHVALGLDEVLLDLEAEGYSTRTFIVPACGVNAPHRRDRLWIIAHSELADTQSIGVEGLRTSGEQEPHAYVGEKVSVCGSEDVADTQSEQSTPDDNGGEQGTVSEPQQVQPRGSSSWGGRGCNWETEPDVGRVAHGIPRRVDRLKGLGNAIVPQIAMQIGLAIKQELKQHG